MAGAPIPCPHPVGRPRAPFFGSSARTRSVCPPWLISRYVPCKTGFPLKAKRDIPLTAPCHALVACPEIRLRLRPASCVEHSFNVGDLYCSHSATLTNAIDNLLQMPFLAFILRLLPGLFTGIGNSVFLSGALGRSLGRSLRRFFGRFFRILVNHF